MLVAAGTEDLGDHFLPGVVIATPRRLEAADKLFTVLKYNNKEVPLSHDGKHLLGIVCRRLL